MGDQPGASTHYTFQCGKRERSQSKIILRIDFPNQFLLGPIPRRILFPQQKEVVVDFCLSTFKHAFSISSLQTYGILESLNQKHNFSKQKRRNYGAKMNNNKSGSMETVTVFRVYLQQKYSILLRTPDFLLHIFGLQDQQTWPNGVHFVGIRLMMLYCLPPH